MEDTINHALELLLNYLKVSRGFDFTGYKRSSLMRRIQKRMQMVGVQNYSDYQDYLEVHPDEFSHLFNSILINVTSFFRDPATWQYLSEKVIPTLLAGKSDDGSIRAWSAGCATGQEACTLAMLLAEAMGMEQFRHRVKIYATDVDEEALGYARHAIYTAHEIAGVPPPLLAKYFEQVESRYVFNRDLRRNVIFGRNDLIQDAPISRIDLLICRNTIMYFNAEAQARILARFHFALNEEGCLFLGKAEMLFSHSNLFTPCDLKKRIFMAAKTNRRDRFLAIAPNRLDEDQDQFPNKKVRLREVVLDAGTMAQVVVDFSGHVALVNEQARALFRLSSQDLGRPFQDLELSYQPAELRSTIERAYAERRPISLKEIKWLSTTGDTRYLDVLVVPLLDIAGNRLGVSLTFADVSRFKQLQAELEAVNRELETSYEEIQSVNEELETTNEELQSTNEELETTNEELHSTNEELETMNEELQSTNEELQSINEELKVRTSEMRDVNAFMNSVLAGLRGGVVVLDRDMLVQVWNAQTEDLWGLRADEVRGQHFLNLDIGLPVSELAPLIRSCLNGQNGIHEVMVTARNRRGRDIRCKVIDTPLRADGNEIRGVILFMEEVEILP